MMQNEMIHTDRVLIVEGKYDAVRLAHLTDAMILLTDGFGIYKDKQRQQLFRALAQIYPQQTLLAGLRLALFLAMDGRHIGLHHVLRTHHVGDVVADAETCRVRIRK